MNCGRLMPEIVGYFCQQCHIPTMFQKFSPKFVKKFFLKGILAMHCQNFPSELKGFLMRFFGIPLAVGER